MVLNILASRTSPGLDPETLLFALGCLVVYICYQKLNGRKIDAIMSGHLGDPPTLADLQERLAAFNETTTSQFVASRHANIQYSGKRISLLDVTVGCVANQRYGTSWKTRREVVAIVPNDDIAWMAKNSDVFTFAHTAGDYSLYWVHSLRARTEGSQLKRPSRSSMQIGLALGFVLVGIIALQSGLSSEGHPRFESEELQRGLFGVASLVVGILVFRLQSR